MNIIDKINNLSVTKKIIVYISVVLIVAILSAATMLIFKNINNKDNQTQTTQSDNQSTDEQSENNSNVKVNDYEKKAATAEAAGDTDLAKSLYTQAKQVYIDNQQDNNAADIQARLYQLNNPPVKPPEAGPIILAL